jgi:hypothetical protein
MPRYYRFGYQGPQFYQPTWAGSRPTMPPSRPGRASHLGGTDWLEIMAPPVKQYPTTRTRRLLAVGDWPPVRPSGPEPLSPGEMSPFQRHPMAVGDLMLSDMEKLAVGALAVAGILWWMSKKKK